MSEITSARGQIDARPKRSSLPSADQLPTIMIEKGLEAEENALKPAQSEVVGAESESEDEVINKVARLDDEIKDVMATIKTHQSFAKTYASNPDIMAKLNEESRIFAEKYDSLLAQREALGLELSKLRVAKN